MVSDIKKGGSMNPERLQLKGLYAEAKKTYRALDTEASGLILLLRSLLNPYEEVLMLDMAKIVSITKRLNTVQSELKRFAEKIKKLEAELE